MPTFHFSLPDVACINCVPTVRNTIIKYQAYADEQGESNTEHPSWQGMLKIRIKRVQVDSLCKTLSLDVDDPACQYKDVLDILKTLLDDVGHTCEPILDDDTDAASGSLAPAAPRTWASWLKKIVRSHWFQGLLGIIVGVGLLVLSLIPGVLPLAALISIAVVSTVLTVVLGAEFYIKAKNQMRDREPAMDTLFAISTIIILVVSIVSFFVPGLPMMFEAALLIFGFRHIGLAIRDSLYNVMGVYDSFQGKAPKSVLKLDADNCPLPTKLSLVLPDDRLLILPNGQMIPIDGWCDMPASDTLEERAVLVSNIDGSTLPRQFKHGDKLLAGMILAEGEKPMRMRVGVEGYHLALVYHVPTVEDVPDNTLAIYLDKKVLYFAVKNKTGVLARFPIDDQALRDKHGVNHAKIIRRVFRDPKQPTKLAIEQHDQLLSVTSKAGYIGAPAIPSYLARIDRAIQIEEKSKGPMQQQTEAILSYFIPTVFLLAVVSGVIISFFFAPAIAIQCAVSVLVSACPCTLGLITPLAFKFGMKKAAGVTFSHGQALEAAADIDCVVFDLNGTLTTGEPVVDASQSDMPAVYLPYLALLEQDVTHPFAKAIYAYSGGQQTIESCALSMDNFDHKSNHSGITANINGQQYMLGNQDMMVLSGVDTSGVTLKAPLSAGDTVIYLAREEFFKKSVVGFVVLKDPLRPDAPLVIDLLKKRGNKVCMCTGADENTAYRYADELKIDRKWVRVNQHGVTGDTVNYKKNSSKKEYIDSLKGLGHRVAMVGDAANDSVAMAASHFSLAIRHLGGNETTQQRAGAVIESGSLLPIVTAFEVSKQTMSNIKENLLFSLSYNIAVVLLAGGLLLAFGVVFNPGVGVALMIVQTCLLLLNVYRFQQQGLDHLNSKLAAPIALPDTTGKSAKTNSYVNIMHHAPGKKSSNDAVLPVVDLSTKASTRVYHASAPVVSADEITQYGNPLAHASV